MIADVPVEVSVDEITVDELSGKGLKIAQPLNGYRFSLDPLLLSRFVPLQERDRVADLGTGCGVIPLLLAGADGTVSIVGIEFQERMAALARHNVAINGYEGRISILSADIADLKKHFPVSSFDAVVANPPYRKPGTGRISPREGRDKARHETTATLADFMAVAKYLVKPGGRICFIYHVSRLAELFAEAVALKLAPLRLRLVHDTAQSGAGMFMIELAKGRRGDLIVDTPLIVRDADGSYTAEMCRVMAMEPAEKKER